MRLVVVATPVAVAVVVMLWGIGEAANPYRDFSMRYNDPRPLWIRRYLNNPPARTGSQPSGPPTAVSPTAAPDVSNTYVQNGHRELNQTGKKTEHRPEADIPTSTVHNARPRKGYGTDKRQGPVYPDSGIPEPRRPDPSQPRHSEMSDEWQPRPRSDGTNRPTQDRNAASNPATRDPPPAKRENDRVINKQEKLHDEDPVFNHRRSPRSLSGIPGCLVVNTPPFLRSSATRHRYRYKYRYKYGYGDLHRTLVCYYYGSRTLYPVTIARGETSSSSSSEEEEESRPKESESAPYNVTCVSPDGYELRQYEEAIWATTINTDCRTSTSFMGRLYLYINGANILDANIPIVTSSSQVRKRMVRRSDSTRDIYYSASVYLPRRFWENPPVPSDKKVFLERSSSLVFASNFSRWAVTSQQYDRLLEVLGQEGQPIIREKFDVQQFIGRSWPTDNGHNEILIEVDTDNGTPFCTPQVTEEPPNGIRQCGDHECPSYSEAQRISDAVVIREVAAGVYATKKYTTCNMTKVMGKKNMPLRRYFQGENVENVSMPATTPILQLAVRPDRSRSRCNFTYQTAFYLPKDHQATPPTPLEESISITETDPMLYYVMSFHEDPTPNTAFEKYNELRALITGTEHCFLPGEFKLAFYEATSRPLPHLYEMWIPVDEQCSDVSDEEDFDEAVFPVDEDRNPILPVMNDDPGPVPDRRGKKRKKDRGRKTSRAMMFK